MIRLVRAHHGNTMTFVFLTQRSGSHRTIRLGPNCDLGNRASRDPKEGPVALRLTAGRAFELSGFKSIDWKIKASDTVRTAANAMAMHNVGCLAVTEGVYFEGGNVCGVISARDIVNKVAFLNRNLDETLVSEVATMGVSNLVIVPAEEPVSSCIEKLLARDIRHLLISEEYPRLHMPDKSLAEDGKEIESTTVEITGLISIKDITKCLVEIHSVKVQNLSQSLDNMGKDMLAQCEGSYVQCTTSTRVVSFSSAVTDGVTAVTLPEDSGSGQDLGQDKKGKEKA